MVREASATGIDASPVCHAYSDCILILDVQLIGKLSENKIVLASLHRYGLFGTHLKSFFNVGQGLPLYFLEFAFLLNRLGAFWEISCAF